MSAPSPPAVVVAPRPPQTGHNFELGNGGGGPPPLATAVLSHLAAGWPALADLRAAASARQGSGRLRNEISALVCDVRVALAAAFLGGLPDEGGNTTRRSEEDALDAAASRSVASRVYSDARTLLVDCGPALRSHWRLSDAQWRELRVALESVVGPAVVADLACEQPCLGSPLSPPRPERVVFEHGSSLFLSAIAHGVRLGVAMEGFSVLGHGAYSHDDRSFYPDTPLLGPLSMRPSVLHQAVRHFIPGRAGQPDITIFLHKGVVAAVSSTRRLRINWLEDMRRSAGGLESLPDFICLPRDESGRPIIPLTRVTALVEAQKAWHTELGQLDAVTSAIVSGKLVMPKISSPSQQTVLRNHPSFDKDDKAKEALGPVIAKWLATGVLEYVGWNDRVPILLQPCGAVPKGTAPFYRLITDARFGNQLYSDWGVSYTSAAQIGQALHRCDFTFSSDIADAYHLSVLRGCGGRLRPARRPVIGKDPKTGKNRVTWVDGMVNGCTPSSCVGGCDKDMSGIMIEGHIFRFAACQFGQKTAGSPLNSIVRSVARYFARLPTPVHVAAWVDDLFFSLSTPPHPICAGHEGGCPVCQEYYGYALDAQRKWHDKARKLHIPLSEKGHGVSQAGAFTGVCIDTFRGLVTMLPDKLQSMVTVVEDLRSELDSTCRHIARVRGKVLHYGCAIAYVSVAAASLSQAIHEKEGGMALADVPTPREEAGRAFEWDGHRRLSARTLEALDFIRRCLEKFGTVGQPLWPLVPSSVYGAFLDGRLAGVRVLVITYDASVFGWGAVIRATHEDKGHVIVGGFRSGLELLGAGYLAPSTVADDPAAQVHRETLAGLLAVQATSKLYALSRFVVLIRGDCQGALTALRKGSFRSPALQDISMKFNQMCAHLDVTPPPLFLHAPGEVLKAEGVDGLSRESAQELRCSESGPALRALVSDEAARLGERFTVDLFASADNALVPRFYARYAEPLAEAVDALVQTDWGWSLCSACGQRHREFCFVFPPRALLSRVMAKARADGLRGVMVVPFAVTDPIWPTLMAVSLSLPDSFDRCRVVPASARYLQNPSAYGAERLAVLSVDFTRLHPQPDRFVAPPCWQATAARVRTSLTAPRDLEDRRRIAARLEELGLAARDAPSSQQREPSSFSGDDRPATRPRLR